MAAYLWISKRGVRQALCLDLVGKANVRTAICPACEDIVPPLEGHLVKISYSYGYKNRAHKSTPMPEWGALCKHCHAYHAGEIMGETR